MKGNSINKISSLDSKSDMNPTKYFFDLFGDNKDVYRKIKKNNYPVRTYYNSTQKITTDNIGFAKAGLKFPCVVNL